MSFGNRASFLRGIYHLYWLFEHFFNLEREGEYMYLVRKCNRVLALFLLLPIVLICGSSSSAVEVFETQFPDFPYVSQQYYVIYREGWRNNRIEVTFFDITDNDGRQYLIWDGNNIVLNSAVKYTRDSKWYLKGSEWIHFEDNHYQPSDHATEIISSNLDIYDKNGNLFLSNDDIVLTQKEDLPAFPNMSQQYYVVYREGWRSNRVEVTFFDVKDDDGAQHLIWDGNNIILNSAVKYTNDSKWYLSKNEWVHFEDNHYQPSNHATAVVQSNLDVYDKNGILFLSSNGSLLSNTGKDIAPKNGNETPVVNNKTEGSPSGWAEEEVVAARQAGLIPEELDNSYQTNITRAEFCLLAAKLIEAKTGERLHEIWKLRSSELSKQSSFADTKNQLIQELSDFGIITGYDNGNFGPNDTITRAQAATLLTRLAKILGGWYAVDPGNAIFTDQSTIPNWAHYSVKFITELKSPLTDKTIMGATGGNYFNHAGMYSREQAFISFGRLADVLENISSFEICVEENRSEREIVITDYEGYLSSTISSEGTRSLFIKHIGSQMSDFLVVKYQGSVLDADKYDVWIRPLGDNPIPFKIEDGCRINPFRPGGAQVTVQSRILGKEWETFYVFVVNNDSNFILSTRMPVKKVDNLPCNFVSSGMYVENYKAESVGNGNYLVTMDVYNSAAIYGALDIYDADGQFLRSERIDKFDSLPSGIMDTFVSGYRVIEDITSRDILTYRQDSFSEHTTIKVLVPEGGKAVLSNNMRESIGAYIYNLSDLIISGISTTSDVVDLSNGDYRETTKIFGTVLLEEIQTHAKDFISMEEVNELFQTINTNFTVTNVAVFYDQLTSGSLDLLWQAGIDLRDVSAKCALSLLKSVSISALETAFEKSAGPAGYALEIGFTAMDVGDLLVQAKHTVVALNATSVTILYPYIGSHNWYS